MFKLFLSALALCGLVAAAQAAEPAPACEGTMVVLRKSEITGTADGFLEATRDHEAWYRANGVTTNSFLATPAQQFNRETGAYEIVPNLYVTLHINPPNDSALPRNDAGWKAFVAKYQANSRIVADATFCLPKGAVD